MIISKTPLRISFFPAEGLIFPSSSPPTAAPCDAAIDKHIYHSVARFPSELFDYSIRLAYRKVECVRSRDEIEHLPFRRILEYFDIDKDIEITLAADLPSFSGLGSSSSFTVGLINALSASRAIHAETGIGAAGDSDRATCFTRQSVAKTRSSRPTAP